MTSPSQRIIENLNTAVLVFDETLRVTSINPAGESLLEISAKQLLGQEFAAFLPGGRRLAKVLRGALESGHPFTERGLRLMLPGHRSITVDCTVTVMLTGTDKELLIELDQVDRLMRLARDESSVDRQAANRAVLRGLAHEIKNPLGGLRGAAQLLERELPNPQLQEYTRIIIREADRLRNLVDRMIGPNRPLQRGAVNIHEVFERVRSLMLAEVPDSINIERDYDPSLPALSGDTEQLIQAILNLARNAVQAMGARGTLYLRSRIERQFTIGQKRHRLVLRAEVEDNGPGVPEELSDQVFYPLVTGRPDGTGLGLSITQTIVSQHGGLIEYRSQPGRTVFSIYLPLE